MMKIIVDFSDGSKKDWICYSSTTDGNVLMLTVGDDLNGKVFINIDNTKYIEMIPTANFKADDIDDKIVEGIVNYYGKNKSNYIAMIKELRMRTGLGLKEAKEAIDKYM